MMDVGNSFSPFAQSPHPQIHYPAAVLAAAATGPTQPMPPGAQPIVQYAAPMEGVEEQKPPVGQYYFDLLDAEAASAAGKKRSTKLPSHLANYHLHDYKTTFKP